MDLLLLNASLLVVEVLNHLGVAVVVMMAPAELDLLIGRMQVDHRLRSCGGETVERVVGLVVEIACRASQLAVG